MVSNGNDGEAGAFTVTDPAGANDVLSIAAVNNPNFLGSLFFLETSSKKKIGPYCKFFFFFFIYVYKYSSVTLALMK